jgi:transmembrane sensor
MSKAGMNTQTLWRQLRHALGAYPNTAAEWAVRVQCADVTRQELLVLDDWLKADPRNAEDYARVNKIGHLGLRLREHRDELARVQGYQRLRESERLEVDAMRGRHRWRWATATAACCAFVVLTVVFWPGRVSGDRYVAGHGEQRQVTLPDGSRMVVNTDSEVNVRYDAMARRVSLPHGEAFFEVAKHPTRPFIVRAGDTEIQAIGTKFSVRRDGAETEVVVTEGRVRVSREGGRATDVRELSPDHRLQVDLKTATAHIVAVNAARATAWAAGTVEFEDAPLDEVVRELNRYTAKTFIVAEPALSGIRLTGRFRVGDMESVKFALRDRFGISAAEDFKEIRLARK